LRFSWFESHRSRDVATFRNDYPKVFCFHPAQRNTGGNHARDRAGSVERVASEMAEGKVQQLANARIHGERTGERKAGRNGVFAWRCRTLPGPAPGGGTRDAVEPWAHWRDIARA